MAGNEAKRFGPGAVGVAENSPHGGGDGAGTRLTHAAHRHAEVLALDDHDDAARLKNVFEGVSNLHGQPFLDLRPLRVKIDQPGEFREAGDLALHVRDVSNVGNAVERYEVVFTRAVHLDVFDDDHLVVV